MRRIFPWKANNPSENIIVACFLPSGSILGKSPSQTILIIDVTLDCKELRIGPYC